MALLADISFTTEGAVAIGALMTALAGAVAVVFKLLIKSKDDQLAMAAAAAEKRLRDEESQKKSYKEIAEEAVAMAELRVNRERGAAGRSAAKTVAPVVPEHSSPVSQEQQKTADLQTLRARVTAAGLDLKLPPREPGPPEGGPPGAGDGSGQLRADIAELKREQLRGDIAELKQDVAEVPEKTAKRIADGEAK